MALILDATPTVYLFHPRMVGVGRIPEQGGHFPADRDVVAPRGRPDRVSYLDNFATVAPRVERGPSKDALVGGGGVIPPWWVMACLDVISFAVYAGAMAQGGRPRAVT